MPKAKAFKHWVTGEVLPALRKNGVYAVSYTHLPYRNDPSRENDISAIHGAAHVEPFPIVPFHFCTKKPPKSPQILRGSLL